jgi:hypothetical protein
MSMSREEIEKGTSGAGAYESDAAEPEFDKRKLAELMLYVAEKSAYDPKFGATKLNKILFYSDFLAYGLFRNPITGATYQRLDQGPAPRQLMPALGELADRGDAVIAPSTYYGHEKKRLVPLREADLSRFSADEIALVDHVIQMLRDHNASEVSALSHAEAAWKIALDRQDIPYEAVFLSDRPPSERDVQRAQELATEYDW